MRQTIRTEQIEDDILVIDEVTERIGINVPTPLEDLDIAGGVRIGTTANSNAGAIRWTGTDFEGYTGSAWVSLTAVGSGGSGDTTTWLDTFIVLVSNGTATIFETVDVSASVPVGTKDIYLNVDIGSPYFTGDVSVYIRKDISSSAYCFGGLITPSDLYDAFMGQLRIPITSARTFQYQVSDNGILTLALGGYTL